MLLLVSASAVAAGFALASASGGLAFGLPQARPEASPAADGRVPGLVLVALGVLCGCAAVVEWRRSVHAWFWAGLSGGAIVIGIVAQASMMGVLRHPVQTMLQAMALGVGLVCAGLAFLQYRAWHLAWGATREEYEATLPGDEHIRRPAFNATRAITIAATPRQVWPWIVQMGYGRAGFYSYDRLDNRGKPSLSRIDESLQHPRSGDWIPMSGTITENTAFKIDRMHPPHTMVWRKPDSTWTWRLTPLSDGRTRVLSRIRLAYDWRSPLVLISLVLMEGADFLMMRKCLLGIKERAERTSRGPVRAGGEATADRASPGGSR